MRNTAVRPFIPGFHYVFLFFLQGLSYPLFPQYVVNIEILEEITFLNTAQGGGLTLDITPG
jgi:hypothetical protein